ncbi:large ribosomal subunit protein bL32m [Cylas formicarius]|uniref:large ribosomal subunit protein bL32m n=1 Tax=Cylas formicarius TaxID=197179 RepID=UPI0029584EEB|nr:large ribosomal subunit protein bL32m [Cylas formicarius]
MAIASLISRASALVRQCEGAFLRALGCRYPPDDLCLVGARCVDVDRPRKTDLLNDIIGDGFLWAVPKSRRTLEKRQKRRFGHPEYILKILRPRKDLRTCHTCGDDYEAGTLCPSCYKRVIDETTTMQDAIQEELKLEPVENEVVVLYEGEKDDKPDEFWQGKRIVEMQKPRPAWFSQNLLQKSTQKPADTNDVKPSELG